MPKSRKAKYFFIIILLIGIITILLLTNSDFAGNTSPTSKNVDRIIIFTTNKGFASDCILIQSQNHFGLIDVSNPKTAQIEDYDGEIITDESLMNTEFLCNGESIANYLQNYLSINHLDFILLTHGHSDHIGGLKEVADSGLVDSNTSVFYKTYSHNKNEKYVPDDDLPEDTLMSFDNDGNVLFYSASTGNLKESIEKESSETTWHNQAFLFRGIDACAKKGAKLIDVSGRRVLTETILQQDAVDISNIESELFKNVSYQIGDIDNYYDDYITFDFENFNLKLFNLYVNTKLLETENTNSIVTLISKGNTNYINFADINTCNQSEQKIARAIANIVSHVDLMKPAHHGTYKGSSALETYDLLQPKKIIVPGSTSDTNGNHCYYQYYTEKKYKTNLYELNRADDGIMITFEDNDKITLNNLNHDDNESFVSSIDNCTIQRKYENFENDQWVSAAKNLPYYDGTADSMDWASFNDNGEPATGWAIIKNKWYYFDENNFGVMVTGWKQINGKWYYLSEKNIKDDDGNTVIDVGERLTGRWQLEKDGKTNYYYFSQTGSEISEFPEATMLTNYTDSEGYIYNKNGICINNNKEEIMLGDVNNDNSVDMKDILIINAYRLGIRELSEQAVLLADVNKDGLVNIWDILKINSYRLGIIDTL